MVYFNEKYEIIAKEATGYSIDSTDNKYYDKCIKVIETDSFAHYSCYEMCVVSFENGEEVSLIVIGSYCSKLFEHSGILEEEIFYLILDNQIVKLDLKDFTYRTYSISKPIGTYYEIYSCQRGFLVYGELELILFDKQFTEQWRYCTMDILFGEKSLQLKEEFISFTDFDGNYHEVDWFGKQRNYKKFVPETVTINMKNIKTPEEFQSAIKQMLGMPDFYGRNWNAYWDGITGLIELPNTLILDGWHEYKKIQQKDAEMFEGIMKDYNGLEDYPHCECIYKFYM